MSPAIVLLHNVGRVIKPVKLLSVTWTIHQTLLNQPAGRWLGFAACK